MLRELASDNPAARCRATADIMDQESTSSSSDDVPLHQRMIRRFEEEWRLVGPNREALVSQLARLFATPGTSLLQVNLLAYALASEGEDGATELISLLGHDDFSVHTYAAEGIGALDNRARWAVPALLHALEQPSTSWTRDVIVRALGNIGGREALAALQSLAARARRAGSAEQQFLEALDAALAAALTQD
jgi:HEAT repeat protein